MVRAMSARDRGKNEPSAARYAPIVTLEEFARARADVPGPIVCTSGGFDPIHPGHCTCILESKARVLEEHGVSCPSLVVIVNGDAFLRAKKGKAFQDLETRCRIVSCLRMVDWVVAFEIEGDTSVNVALRGIRPDFFTKGGDRTDFTNIPEWETCQELGIRIVPRTGLDKRWSSSDFLRDWGDFVSGRKP